MAADPFRRPPAIDIPWGERERWWTRTTRRLADRSRWGKAATLAELGELVAQFCEGKLLETPDHCGPRDPETVGIAAPLAHANRQGFVTTGSQPGHNHREWEQRAAVDGWAAPATVRQLRGLVAGTRLRMQVVTERPRRSNYDDVVNVSRQHTPSGVWEHTHFGFTPGTREPFIDLGRSDLTEGAHYVTIYDPKWGGESLLWDRLGQADWNSPEPPERTPEVNDSWSASCGDGECGWIGSDWATGDEAAAELRRHEAESGHVNYTAGDVPPGTTITLPDEPYVLDVVSADQLPDGMVRLNGVDGSSYVMAASWPVERYTQERADLEAALVLDEEQRHPSPAQAATEEPQKKPPPDIHDLRRGRWYDEKPITTSTGSTGGTGVSSIEQVRAGIMASNEKANEALGAAQQAHACVEEAQARLMRAAEGSGQGDVSTALGLLAQVVADLDGVMQKLSAEISEAEGVANRL